MKPVITVYFASAFLLLGCANKTKPYVGTYALEITDESREVYDMFKDMDMPWPEITFNEDGTFVFYKTEGNIEIKGTYTVKGAALTLKATDVGGKPPEGMHAEPFEVEFRDNFQILLIDGSDKEPFVRKEKNEAFLKEE